MRPDIVGKIDYGTGRSGIVRKIRTFSIGTVRNGVAGPNNCRTVFGIFRQSISVFPKTWKKHCLETKMWPDTVGKIDLGIGRSGIVRKIGMFSIGVVHNEVA